MSKNNSLALVIISLGLFFAIYVNNAVDKTWLEQSYLYDTYQTDSGENAYIYKGKEVIIKDVVPYHQSPLKQENLNLSINELSQQPPFTQQWVEKDNQQLTLLKPAFHFGLWSLLPAFITIALCLLTREPLSSLFAGIVVGSIMLGQYDLTDAVIIPNLAKEGTAGLLLL